MSQLKWLSEHAMLRDLAEVAGVGSFDCITAVTDKPPAVFEREDIDEYHLRFETERDGEETNEGPDLKLIGEMLEMVNKYDEENEPVCEAQNDEGTILKISKLNPNVPEFVPKDISLNTSNESKKEHNKENNNSNIEIDAAHHSTNRATATEETIQNLKTKIKNGIKSEPPVRSKILRNAAIMSLLKLHSIKSHQPTKIKLLTPDDFIGNNGAKLTNVEISSTESRISNDGSLTQTLPNLAENVQASLPTTSIKKENEDGCNKRSEHAINVSITKVDNWLSGSKPKEQKLRLHMGPITYKRKATKIEQIDPQSQSSTRSSSPQGPKKHVPKKHVPSDLAKELYKEYKERSLKNLAIKEDIWAPVEREMRERDKKIKEKEEKSELQEIQEVSHC